MTVRIRYAALNEYKCISEFLDTYWAKDHVYVRLPHLFDWTFRRSSLWEEDGYSIAIAESDHEIIGMLGGIPFMFNNLGQVSRGIWLVNYIVRQDYRRGVFALRLLELFRRPPHHTVISFGVNPSIIPFFRALGAQISLEMPRHVAVLPTAVERMAVLLTKAYPDWPAHRAYALAYAFRLTDLPEYCADFSNVLPLSWNQHDWPRIAAKTVGAARDLDYLTWRYRQHPCFDYRFITVSEGKDTGLAVWRLETIREAMPLGITEADRIGRLVEFLPVSSANAQNLLSVFWRQLQEADAIGADFYGYHSEICSWLGDAGFHGVDGHPDGRAIPSRFQPLDGRGGSIQSAVFVGDGVPSGSIEQNSFWYWTKSDSDQDRPN
jgi:hypothetical protein